MIKADMLLTSGSELNKPERKRKRKGKREPH